MVNIMNEYITYTKKSLNNYMKYILNSNYDKGIVTRFIDEYIDVRYSNYVDGYSDNAPISKKIDHGLNIVSKELQNTLPDKKKATVTEIEELFKIVIPLDSLYILEQQTKNIEKISELRKHIYNIEDNDFIKTFDKLVKDDIRKKREFLNNFNSDTFYLNKKKLENETNLYYVDVKDKIKFPELYSEIAIKKAREKSNINEDILSIGYSMITAEIINNIINNKYDNTYCIKIPKSIFDKVTKRNRLLSIIDNEFIIEHIELIVTFDCFQNNRGIILELKHQGYQFAISLDKTFDYSSDNLEYLEIFDYIFILKDKYYYKDLTKNVKIGKRIKIVDEVE